MGDAVPESAPLIPVPGSNLTPDVDFRLGDIDLLPPSNPVVEKLGLPVEVGVSFSGKGNNGPLSFFRRFSLKKVVVVEMVCVVVVLAYTFSPELASDLDESDNLSIGMASCEPSLSP